MERVKRNEDYELINPRNGKIVQRINAGLVFDSICENAWATGDPGIVFLTRINEKNPTPELGMIEATNPCGEQPLLPYESCNLGSINLVRMFDNGKFDWNKFERTINSCVHFLDNVIAANKFPMPEIEKITKGNRKIGLGIMGFADALIRLGIPYDSEAALDFADKLGRFLFEKARAKSQELALERGVFPNFKNSIHQKKIRNATVTTIAPTGTLSIIANTSSGIEPLFAIAYIREVMGGLRLPEVNLEFERIAKERKFYSSELLAKISRQGSIKNLSEIPEDVRKIFPTALDINPEWHVRIQATFQKYIDNAVSKTINLPQDSTPETVKKIFLLAHNLGCKGITVFRYGSKRQQVLYFEPSRTQDFIRVSEEFSGGCPATICPV